MTVKMRALRGSKRSLVCGVALWGGALLSAAPAFGQSFSNFYVFGDSLSDAGTFRSPLAPGVGLRFTTNPGLEWNQVLGAFYGISVTPYKATVANATLSGIASSTILGGNNYAQGGACVSSGYGTNCPMNALNDLGISQQISTYLAATGGRASSSALYSVYGGGNDVFSQLQFVSNGTATPTLAVLAMQTAGADEAKNVAALVNAGARFILVPSLADVGNTPLGSSLGSSGAGLLTALSSSYNAALNAGLQSIGGTSIIYVDVARLAAEIISSPAAYGLTNVTTPACSVSDSVLCSSATLVAANADSTYFFADDVHPTTAIQKAEAQYIASVLAAPGKIALLAESPIFAARAVDRALDERTQEKLRFDDGWTVFGNADIAPNDLTPAYSNAARGTNSGGHFGMEYGGTSGLKLGAMVSITEGSFDFSGGAGRYDQSLTTQTLYGIYSYRGAFAELSATIGQMDFDNVKRITNILSDTRVNSGKTHGIYGSGRLLIGRDHHLDGVVLTPLASLAYEQATVNGYTESQSDSTTMTFGRQYRHLMVGSIGGRATTSVSVGSIELTPNVTVMYSDDFTVQKRYVLASVSGAPTNFAMPVNEPGHGWTTISAGVEAPLGHGIAVSAGGGGAVGQRGASSSFGTFGVSYRF
ncbi:autotransporter domain-containing protein [Telmatospirillum sp.]|uniref:autotransporter domain-containing protein n=1 Tax=Telmatospirillum sp. TaxID=2079197 RepID=UPI00283BC833|nr:autotransporter domain-containing protein [Telmatospirillum sp.]MDR3439469.1 autotransporter domain-containing protein [Telmatospirillum sp.]